MKKNILIIWLFMLIFISGAYASEYGAVDIHGFISQGYLKSRDYEYFLGSTDGTFQFNEMGINFSTKLSKQLRIGIQIFSRDIGNIGNDEVVVDWAVADYYFCKYFGIRAGRIKMPAGLYNETRDVDVVRTGIFLNQSVYYEILRDATLAINGIGIYGESPSGVLGNLCYQFMTGSTNIDEESGVAQGIIGLSSMDTITDIDYKWACVGGLKWMTPFSGLVLGATGMLGKMDVYGYAWDYYILMAYDPYITYTFSIEYSKNNFVFVTEYMRMNIDYMVTAKDTNLHCPGDTEKILGWYSTISYRFLPRFEGALSYSEFYDNADDKKGAGRENNYNAWQKDVTISLRFDINENWVLKLEDHIIDGNSQVLIQNGGNYDVRYWNMWAVKLSFIF